MEFIASLVRSLAWPAAVVIAVLVFRRQLSSLLSEPLRRIKAGPIEMEFIERVAVLEAQLDVEPDAPSASPSPDSLSAQLDRVAEIAPQAAVMEAHARVELRLRDMLSDSGLTPERPTGMRRLAELVAQHGLIGPEAVRAIEGMTVLRNLAAHGGARDLSSDRAREYLALADTVLFTLREPPSPPVP